MSTPIHRSPGQRFLDMSSTQDSLMDDSEVEDPMSPSPSPVKKKQVKRRKQAAAGPSSSGSAGSAPRGSRTSSSGAAVWNKPLRADTSLDKRKGKRSSPSTATNVGGPSLSEQEIQHTAKRKLRYISVSTRIRSPSQLFWHRPEMEVYPCRTCERDEALGLPGIPDTWDEKRKVLVQYIVYPNVGKMKLVSRKQLTPYHGHGHGSSGKKRKVQRADGTMLGGGSWCENLLERYRKQRSKQLRNGTINSGGTSANGGKRKSKAKKGGSAPIPSRDDVRVDVLVQTLYLQKVLDSVRSQEASGSGESCGSDSDHSRSDGNARGSNWGSKMKNKDTTFEFSDEDKKDISSSDSEGEEEKISWSQELNNRLESRQKKQAKSKYNNVSSSEDSNDEDVDDDEGTEPTSFSEERDTRMEVKKGAASSTTKGRATANAKPKSRDQDVGSDSSSSSSSHGEELRQDSTRRLNDSAETNESISLSSDSSDCESEEETGPAEEEPPPQKTRSTGRSSKGRVSFARTPSTHDDAGGSDEDVEEDDDHEPMDIPYTQALGLESDDDYLPPPVLDPENIKSKEPIRPGDVIEYSSFLFVAGDKRGHREARVISVDPSRDPALVLDTGDILPNDTRIRRIKVLVGDKLRAHAGVSRPIHSFVMEKAAMKGRSDKISAGFAKEASRVGSIIRRNMTKFQEKAEADGFAPMDVMNKYKGTNFDSNDDVATNQTRKMKKASGLPPIKEHPGNGFTAKTTRPSSNEGNRKKTSIHESSSQSSALSESSSSHSEEEQPQKSLAKSKTKWIASKQATSKKKHSGASPAVDLSSSSDDDDDVMCESPSLRLPTVPKRSGSTKGRDVASSASSSSSSDSENSWDEGKKSSNKRKSPEMKKTPKRDVWDTSPRKKSSAAKKKKKNKKHDSLSFESSDDDFEPKGRRRMITVSDKKKKPSKPSSSKKKAKAQKNSSPSNPLIDMTSSDEKKNGGWLQSLGGGTKKSKTSNATIANSRRRKKKREEGRGDGNSDAGTGAATASQSAPAFSIRRFK